MEFLPGTVLVLVSTETATETRFSFLGTSVDDCFPGWSGKIIELEGTRAARSGGWSFPTAGLACMEIKGRQMMVINKQ